MTRMKVLIANRGEIAVRVIRACREMGIPTVAVYSECDRAGLHVRFADEAYAIGPERAVGELPPHRQAHRRRPPLRCRRGASRLRISGRERRLRARVRGRGADVHRPVARRHGADGQQDRGSSRGDRRGRARGAGHRRAARPVGQRRRDLDAGARRSATRCSSRPWPAAAARACAWSTAPDDLPSAIRAARSEAGSSFGDPHIYLERQLQFPRHIEIQLLADHHGTVVPFVERECSIQRRHQKVLEESPSVGRHAGPPRGPRLGRVRRGARGRLHERRHDRVPAGPRRAVLLPGDEHAAPGRAPDHRAGVGRGPGALAAEDRAGRARSPLTPAAGADAARPRDRVPHLRRGPRQRLHAVARPDARPARARRARDPSRRRRRDAGLDVPIFYDPLIAKLVGVGRRPGRRRSLRMARALGEYEVRGIKTSIPFFRWLLDDVDFREGRFDTTFLDRELARRTVGRSSRSPTRPSTSRCWPRPSMPTTARRRAARGGAGAGALRAGSTACGA